jgi:diguanylate cyclase (GGDEF)-like protein
MWLLQSVWMLGLPATVSLAAVALVGYVFGQRTRLLAVDQVQMRRELKRARGIIRDLERVAQQVRRDLARHQGSLGQFRSRLRDMSEAQQQEPIDLLACETEKLLAPTQKLSQQLALAYEMIRKQAGQLTSFSEVRTDGLTGLGNRRELEEVIANQVEMQSRYGMICSVAMFEIDLFQHLNADQGEARGDQVLKQVGELLDQHTRESDLVCRFGGEEFVAVLPGTSLPGAVAFAERMRTTVERFSPVTVSCGVAEINAEDNAARLLSRADAALYSAKASGRNQVFQHTGRSVSCATAKPLPSLEGANELRLDQSSSDQAARETIRDVALTLRSNLRSAKSSTEFAAG